MHEVPIILNPLTQEVQELGLLMQLIHGLIHAVH